MEISQKIARLKELIGDPEQNAGAALRLFHDLFQQTHQGRDMSPEDAEWLSRTACLFLSPELRAALVKLRLDVYSFQFAALDLTGIDDVIDDLSNNGEILKGIHSFPAGSYNKLKRELLGAQPSNAQSQPALNTVPAAEVVMETKKSDQEEPERRSIQGETTKKKVEDGLLYKSLLKNFMAGNKEGVMESLRDFVNDEHFSIKTTEVKYLLRQSAKLLLSTEVTEVLEKNLLGEYSYLLAVNHVLELEDLKEDVAKGDILKGVLPQCAFNKLERQLLASIPSLPSAPSSVNLPEGGPQNHSLPSGDIGSPPKISKPRRLVEKLLPFCINVGKNQCGMELYQFPLTRDAQSRSSKTERWILGERSSTKVESKTILLMGATGSGKTTLINAMFNYILGVEWDDPFRFLLINDEGDSTKPTSQMHSQTSKVTAYELHHQEGFKIPYSLVIVDTPGYGDTKGVERDYEITDSIQQFFKDDKGIQVLDAVGFTVQAALARLTPTQKYIFESILAIFGNDVRDNIRFLVTFTDGQTPPVLEAIKGANITQQFDIHGHPLHHRFNNSGFFTSNQMDGDADFGPMFWKLGMKSFESFFSGLTTMKTRSLTLTKEVLEERKRINITIDGLTLKIHQQLTKMDELSRTKQMIENHSDQINANKDFKYEVTVSKGEKVPITDGTFTTNCSKCSMSCHFPCIYPNDADKRNCAAMGKEDGLCTSCPLKCSWDLHTNQPYHWEFKDVTESRTYDEVKKKYEEALHKKLSTEGVLQHLGMELDQIKFELNRDIEQITGCLRRLDQIALRPDAFTSTDYIELMIQAEMKEKKPGFQDRIERLESLLSKARVMQKIRAGESIIPGEAAATAAVGQPSLQIERKGFVASFAQYLRAFVVGAIAVLAMKLLL